MNEIPGTDELMERADHHRSRINAARDEVKKIIVGHSEVIDEVLVCLFCNGHALVEGVPGLGKTSLIKALGDAMSLSASRVQFTPDLVPSNG